MLLHEAVTILSKHLFILISGRNHLPAILLMVIDVAGANDRSSQNYGFRVGGPIIKNKLFFFVSGEYENESIPGVTWKPSTDGVCKS